MALWPDSASVPVVSFALLQWCTSSTVPPASVIWCLRSSIRATISGSFSPKPQGRLIDRSESSITTAPLWPARQLRRPSRLASLARNRRDQISARWPPIPISAMELTPSPPPPAGPRTTGQRRPRGYGERTISPSPCSWATSCFAARCSTRAKYTLVALELGRALERLRPIPSPTPPPWPTLRPLPQCLLLFAPALHHLHPLRPMVGPVAGSAERRPP